MARNRKRVNHYRGVWIIMAGSIAGAIIGGLLASYLSPQHLETFVLIGTTAGTYFGFLVGINPAFRR